MDNRFDNVHTFRHITKTAYFKSALADLLSKIYSFFASLSMSCVSKSRFSLIFFAYFILIIEYKN